MGALVKDYSVRTGIGRKTSTLVEGGSKLSGHCSELATLENALFAFEPTIRTVPTTKTRMTPT